jgi:hypothetical protein
MMMVGCMWSYLTGHSAAASSFPFSGIARTRMAASPVVDPEKTVRAPAISGRHKARLLRVIRRFGRGTLAFSRPTPGQSFVFSWLGLVGPLHSAAGTCSDQTAGCTTPITTLCCALVAPKRPDAPTFPPQSPRFCRFHARPRDGKLLASPWPPSREGGPSSLGKGAGPSCRPCVELSACHRAPSSRPRGGKPEARIPAFLGMAWVTPGFPSDHRRGAA